METYIEFMQRRARARAVAALEASTDQLICEIFNRPVYQPRPAPKGWYFQRGWVLQRQAE